MFLKRRVQSAVPDRGLLLRVVPGEQAMPEHGQPMRPEQILEDIMQDYANKTVTIEAFPHLSSGIYASIHPCKHSSVMKKIVDHLNDSGRTARVDQYIFIFLKFIQSVIPTMNYDHTMAMEATTWRECFSLHCEVHSRHEIIV